MSNKAVSSACCPSVISLTAYRNYQYLNGALSEYKVNTVFCQSKAVQSRLQVSLDRKGGQMAGSAQTEGWLSGY